MTPLQGRVNKSEDTTPTTPALCVSLLLCLDMAPSRFSSNVVERAARIVMSNLGFGPSYDAGLLAVVRDLLLLYIHRNQARTVLDARTRDTVWRALQA